MISSKLHVAVLFILCNKYLLTIQPLFCMHISSEPSICWYAANDWPANLWPVLVLEPQPPQINGTKPKVHVKETLRKAEVVNVKRASAHTVSLDAVLLWANGIIPSENSQELQEQVEQTCLCCRNMDYRSAYHILARLTKNHTSPFNCLMCCSHLCDYSRCLFWSRKRSDWYLGEWTTYFGLKAGLHVASQADVNCNF